MKNGVVKVTAVGVASLWLGVWTGQGQVITNLYENFTDPVGWTTFETPPFHVTTDAGRTVIGATNSSESIISRSDFAAVANVGNGPLSILVEYRETFENDTTPFQLGVHKKGSDPIVPGHIAFLQMFPRGSGNFEFRVYRYTNAVGDTEVIVNVATNQSFPTSYLTLRMTRTNDGQWTATRSDTGATIFDVKESAVATGGLLGVVEMRDRAFSKPGQANRYFDSLIIISAAAPAPSSQQTTDSRHGERQ